MKIKNILTNSENSRYNWENPELKDKEFVELLSDNGNSVQNKVGTLTAFYPDHNGKVKHDASGGDMFEDDIYDPLGSAGDPPLYHSIDGWCDDYDGLDWEKFLNLELNNKLKKL